jgi:hypothetical protein
MLFLLWVSTTVGEGRLRERLRIYSGKLFIDKIILSSHSAPKTILLLHILIFNY